MNISPQSLLKIVVCEQALSGGQFKHVIGRPISNGDKEDHISMAFLYSTPTQTETASIIISGSGSGSSSSSSKPVDLEKGKIISLSQQAIAALLLTLVYHLLVYVYYKF